MKSHIIPLLLLLGVIYAALIAAHSHDWIGLPDEDALEESSGSGNNSAEVFMNEMVPIWEEEDNSTYYISAVFNDALEESSGEETNTPQIDLDL